MGRLMDDGSVGALSQELREAQKDPSQVKAALEIGVQQHEDVSLAKCESNLSLSARYDPFAFTMR